MKFHEIGTNDVQKTMEHNEWFIRRVAVVRNGSDVLELDGSGDGRDMSGTWNWDCNVIRLQLAQDEAYSVGGQARRYGG